MIPIAEPWIGEEELKYVTDAVKSGWIAKGDYIQKFEKKCAEFLGVNYAFAVCSGTAALEVALRALELDKKDAITSSCSCAATANGILHAGYNPIFVDISKDDYNIDVNQIERHITNKTGVMIPIHLFGQPCNMDPIMEIAKKHNLKVIEDCAQTFGAKYKGKTVGTFGDLACFSFYANKILTTGEGGLVSTNNPELAEKIKLLRNQGQNYPFHHVVYSYNFKITNMQAAIGLGQIEKIKEIIQKRKDNAKIYFQMLKDVKGLILPKEISGREHNFFSFPLMLKDKSKEEFCHFLEKKGIETRPIFCAMSEQPYFKKMFPDYKEKYPVNDEVYSKGFYVSCSPTLKKEEIKYIVSSIKDGLNV